MGLTLDFLCQPHSIGDVAAAVKNRRKRRKLLAVMLTLGIIMDIIELATVIYGIITGIWRPLIPGIPIVIMLYTSAGNNSSPDAVSNAAI